MFKNRKELAAEPDQRRLNLFATGHRVGDLAKQLFPGGVEIEYRQSDYQGMIDETSRYTKGENVVYEGSFSTNGVFVRADILVKNGPVWDIYEVKATASTKAVHKPDVAIQWYVIGKHLALGKAYLVHLDTSYVRHGELDIQSLFRVDDITDDVQAEQASIESNLENLKAMLAGGEPDIPIGTHCKNPYECDFLAHCWQDVPYPSILDLCRLNGDRKFKLYHNGVVTYEDTRNHIDLNAVQALQVETALSREPYIDTGALTDYLRDVRHPISCLDFETFQEAIPRFDGQGPYKNIPFQYSLHILHQNGDLEHREFLADETGDPRLGLTRRLLHDIPDDGTIFAFHQSFEIGVINGLARHFDRYAAQLTALIGRFKDLEIPFNRLMYYHPDFHGSFSIKSVLPALFPRDPELDYKNLDIQSGDVAMDIFPHLNEIDDPDKKAALRESLLAYCRLDTLAMVKIWQRLNKTINSANE
ncbi:MAG: DUF2779 domain-containing protein [Gammaproteobacteria bacterium]|nr:DUF2779 domain-containing protein [Gammaproteobacteria bacterium]MDH3535604.1 DUF2779 domain-containing protein [Gammaproteobacteria bacterium]